MEGFFLESSKGSEVELLDLLLRRYPSIDYVLNLEINTFLDLVKLAREKELEKEIRLDWLGLCHDLNAEYKTYEAFKAFRIGKNIDMRSNEEIIKDIEDSVKKAGIEWTFLN